MIKRCTSCGKPLTEFEVSFHDKAGSPSAISSKCWICSGAEEQFANGYTDKPNHRFEILMCILAVAALVALLIPVVPYLNSYDVPMLVELYSYALVVIYFAIGTFVFYLIRRKGGKKPEIREWDPPMTRYEHTYGPDTEIYKTTVNKDGDFVTTKETRLGGSVDDKWSAHAPTTGSNIIDRGIDLYSKFFAIFITPCIYLLAGGTFIFWAIPYILIMSVRDKNAKSFNATVPKKLQQAYRRCRKDFGKSPISYDDKVGYLVSKAIYQNKKAEQKNSFLSHYTGSEEDADAPFFYTHKDDVSYMIVEYKRPENKNFGITFLLVDDGENDLQKRIVVGDGFLPTDPQNWQSDWKDLGVSQYTMTHLDWYEKKMRSIMRSFKKNSEIVGGR